MSLKRVWIPSPNYSSRGGSSVRLIVLHTAEGARTYQSLGSFFGNPSSGVSSHVGIDDTPNTVGEYVTRGSKAWTQGNANPVAVSAELCAFAAWSEEEWNTRTTMLSNCAAWIAEEAIALGIPITKLTSSQALDGHSKGVCQHVDLGSWGGGHTDCGPNFPIDRVLQMASNGSDENLEGGPPVPFILYNNKLYWFIADGGKSYWRAIPDGMKKDVPEGMIIKDPNGSWFRLWKSVG